jgi:hypothetical protein
MPLLPTPQLNSVDIAQVVEEIIDPYVMLDSVELRYRLGDSQDFGGDVKVTCDELGVKSLQQCQSCIVPATKNHTVVHNDCPQVLLKPLTTAITTITITTARKLSVPVF